MGIADWLSDYVNKGIEQDTKKGKQEKEEKRKAQLKYSKELKLISSAGKTLEPAVEELSKHIKDIQKANVGVVVEQVLGFLYGPYIESAVDYLQDTEKYEESSMGMPVYTYFKVTYSYKWRLHAGEVFSSKQKYDKGYHYAMVYLTLSKNMRPAFVTKNYSEYSRHYFNKSFPIIEEICTEDFNTLLKCLGKLVQDYVALGKVS
ncbi:MAG: hypothetical protein ABIA11_01640 [Patescibacteria group bacterium]